MLEDLLRVYALARVQAHYLVEQVNELGVVHPFLPAEIKAFLKAGNKIAEALTEKLVLFRHDLDVVATRHSEEAHVDATVAVELEHTTLQ